MNTKLKMLIKNGRISVKGIKEYHDLEQMAQNAGYKISNGNMVGRIINIRLIRGEA